jgi:glutamate-1-semialdehyde 2,1-aminomutase
MDLLASSTASERLSHPGTFNANPVSAAAGIAALDLVANQPINEMADLAAARLKNGLQGAITRTEVLGHVHGIASIVHVALGVGCDCEGEICTLPHSQLRKATAPPVNTLLKLSMLNEGVDMMGGIGFMVSAVHEEAQIDRTIEAFERTLYGFRKAGVL